MLNTMLLIHAQRLVYTCFPSEDRNDISTFRSMSHEVAEQDLTVLRSIIDANLRLKCVHITSAGTIEALPAT